MTAEPTAPPCTWHGCTDPVFARNLCGMHYYRQRRGADMDAPKRTPAGQCQRSGCDQPHIAKGLCRLHYNQKRLGTGGVTLAPGTRLCTHPGCGDPVNAKGLCNMHYQRQRTGCDMDAPRQRHLFIGPVPKCSVENCFDGALWIGFCGTHYSRHKLGLNMAKPKRPRYQGPDQETETGLCFVIGTDGQQCTNYRLHANGMCRMHRARERAGTDLTRPKRARTNQRVDPDGYIQVRAGTGSKWFAEHRMIMERLLGRPLRKGETVHHRNGQRADNTTNGPLDKDFKSGNLELWSSSQPSGQRVADKIEWALALLAEYGR